MSVIGLFAKDWDESPSEDEVPQYPISLKKFGGSITLAANTPASDYYDRLCAQARLWQERREARALEIILGVRLTP